MIFYGWRKRVRPLLNIGTYHCSQCGDRPFHIIVNYSYFHLYWIFGFITGRRYIAACTNCSRGALLEKKQVQPLFAPKPIKDPISFMERWGFTILASAAIVVFIAAMHR